MGSCVLESSVLYSDGKGRFCLKGGCVRERGGGVMSGHRDNGYLLRRRTPLAVSLSTSSLTLLHHPSTSFITSHVAPPFTPLI